MEKYYLNPYEAGQLLGLNKYSVLNLVWHGRLKPITIDNEILLKRDQLERFKKTNLIFLPVGKMGILFDRRIREFPFHEYPN